ncbi:hypothetical protein ACFWNN_21935 [Lentzea sp. NPDC058450]|uniref:hypothetical protein n=1 Tax=Lentzea sp. NPDC058450 TaxID=3346505 RepID=UPI003663BC53
MDSLELMAYGMGQHTYSPDGLDEASIDALIADVQDELADLPFAPTSALLDGTARTQMFRRIERRALGATVRVLHVEAITSAPFGTEAA